MATTVIRTTARMYPINQLTELRLTDHLRLDEQSADESAVANAGKLYTKDLGGVTELFYIASDGGVSQLTSAGANISGWFDDGATVRLVTAGDELAIGTATAQASTKITIVPDIAADNALLIRNAADGANQVAITEDRQVKFTGAGTVTAAAGNLTLSTTTSGDIILTPAGTGVNVSAGVLQVGGTTVITAARNFQPDLTVTFQGASGTVTKAGGNLTISTTTSGDIILTPAADVNISSGGLEIAGTAAIDSSRNFAPNLTITFGGATGTVTKAGGNLTISTTTSGDILLTPAGTGVNLSAGVLQVGGTTVIDASRNFQPDLTVTFQGATGTVTKAGGNLTLSTTTSGDIILTPAGTGVNVSAGVLQVGGTTVITAARNFQPDLTVTFQGASGTVTKAGGNLTISTTTSGDIILTPAADVNISSGGLEIAGTAAIDSSRNFAPNLTITFGGASGTVTKAGGDITISTTTSGAINLAPQDYVTITDGKRIRLDGATGNYTISKAAGHLLLSTSGSTTGDIQLFADGDVDITAGGLEIAGTAAIDSSRNFAPNLTVTFGGATGTVTKAGGNLTISTTTSGDILLVSAGDIRAIDENLVLASPASVDKILSWDSGNSRFDVNDLLNVGGSSGLTFSAAASIITSTGDLTLAPAGALLFSQTLKLVEVAMDLLAGAASGATGQLVHQRAASQIAANIAAADFSGSQIDYPRNVYVLMAGTGGHAAGGNVVVNGTLADGTASQSETIVIPASSAQNAVVVGVKAFAVIDSIDFPATGANEELDVRMGRKLGLANAINAIGDVYKVKKNTANLSVGSVTVNTANGTVDVGANIAANDDYTIVYKVK